MTEQAVARTMNSHARAGGAPGSQRHELLPLGTKAERPAACPIVAKGDSSVQQMLQICHNKFERLRVDFSCFSGPASRRSVTTWNVQRGARPRLDFLNSGRLALPGRPFATRCRVPGHRCNNCRSGETRQPHHRCSSTEIRISYRRISPARARRARPREQLGPKDGRISLGGKSSPRLASSRDTRGWMGDRPRVGLRLHGGLAARRCIELAAAAEAEAAFPRSWFAENPMERGVMAALAGCAGDHEDDRARDRRLEPVPPPSGADRDGDRRARRAARRPCGARHRLRPRRADQEARHRQFARPLGALLATRSRSCADCSRGESFTHKGSVFSVEGCEALLQAVARGRAVADGGARRSGRSPSAAASPTG